MPSPNFEDWAFKYIYASVNIYSYKHVQNKENIIFAQKLASSVHYFFRKLAVALVLLKLGVPTSAKC